MKIHFYGRLAETFGRDIEVELPEGCSIADLRERLAIEHRVRACVGDDIVPDSHILRSGGSVEFFPPVSGG